MSPLALASFTLPAPQPPRGISFSNSHTVGTSLLSSSSSSVCCSVSISSTTTLLSVYCGRGDKKTARGKRFNRSYGNARPRNKKKGRGPPTLPVPPAPRKDKFDDNEKIEIELDESLFSS